MLVNFQLVALLQVQNLRVTLRQEFQRLNVLHPLQMPHQDLATHSSPNPTEEHHLDLRAAGLVAPVLEVYSVRTTSFDTAGQSM